MADMILGKPPAMIYPGFALGALPMAVSWIWGQPYDRSLSVKNTGDAARIQPVINATRRMPVAGLPTPGQRVYRLGDRQPVAAIDPWFAFQLISPLEHRWPPLAPSQDCGDAGAIVVLGGGLYRYAPEYSDSGDVSPLHSADYAMPPRWHGVVTYPLLYRVAEYSSARPKAKLN